MRISRIALLLAAVLICALASTGTLAGVYSKELVGPADFGFGIYERVEGSEAAGGLILSRSMNCVPYLWVPSPTASLVAKIDARSGRETARYQMGPESSNWKPCAVAIDYAGNAYVACADGDTGHIVRIQAFGGSRSINRAPETTSFDFTGDGRADALPWGRDTRVSVVAELRRKPTSLAFDQYGLLWVGLSGEQSIVALEASTGVVFKTIYLPGNPDTMIVGSRDSLWVLCGDHSRLACVDPLLGAVRDTFDLGDLQPRSICEGEEGMLWLGTGTGIAQFEVATGSVVARSDAEIALGGIATDRGGSVWAACPDSNVLTRFSPTDLRMTARVPVGRKPVSVCADQDGYIWALNQDGSSASRVDPRSVTCSVTTLTVPGPCSNTPFTACLIKPGISRSGSWRGLFDGKIPGAGWGTITWNASLAGSKLIVEARSAEMPTDIASQPFQQVSNGQQSELPNGRYLEVRVQFNGGLNTTPVLRYLRVDGRNLPPDTSRAGANPSIIRRLDHQMQTVEIGGVVDPEGDEVTITITGVTQDEPVAGLFPGDKALDAVGTGKDRVQLRCECDPGTEDKPGNGRVYTVSFRATDALGANSTGKVKVMIPASLKWDATAVEDKDKYDSTKDPSGGAG